MQPPPAGGGELKEAQLEWLPSTCPDADTGVARVGVLEFDIGIQAGRIRGIGRGRSLWHRCSGRNQVAPRFVIWHERQGYAVSSCESDPRRG